MGVAIGVLIVAALIGGVVWNHKNAEAAMTGVQFGSSEPPHVVASAIQAAYCGGAKAKAKSVMSGVTVMPLAGSAFGFVSKIGDEGRIEVQQGRGSGTVVIAAATSLHLGLPPKQPKSGLMALSWAMTQGLYRVAGVRPNAAKMKRFVNGLEGRVAKQIQRSYN